MYAQLSPCAGRLPPLALHDAECTKAALEVCMVSSIIHVQPGDSKNTRPQLDGVRLLVSHKQKYDFALKYVFDGPKRQQIWPMSGICALENII